MNKHLVNLIGASASLAIIVLGVVVFAFPLFSSANSTAASADDVAEQNRIHQVQLDAFTAQAADMTALDATVAELRAEFPMGAHVDDIVLLAALAVEAEGGSITSIAAAPSEPFTSRTGDAESVASAPAPEATAESDPAAVPADGGATGSPAPVAPTDGAQQVGVTIGIDAPDVAVATRIIDALRAGPRLVAVTQASVSAASESGVSLSVTLLAFFRP